MLYNTSFSITILYYYLFRQTQKCVCWKVAVTTVQHSKIIRLQLSDDLSSVKLLRKY